MTNRLPQALNGDGFSLTVPRPRLRLMRRFAVDLTHPDGRQRCTLHLVVVTRGMRDRYDYGVPDLRWVYAGPVALGYQLTVAVPV